MTCPLHPISLRRGILPVATALLLPHAAFSQEGHTVTATEIRADRASHWRAWGVVGGTVEIAPDGSVSPRFLRKNINAALDALEFSTEDTQGGVLVGSNPADANLVLDGDMSTSWGPNLDDPLDDWWIELHLGRIVVVQKIVLRFADEGDGDPFLQFKVRAWRTPTSRLASVGYLDGTDVPKFWELGRTFKPNKAQREFEFFPDPESQNPFLGWESQISANADFVGDPLDRIQIIITDSDFDRGAELSSEAEWAALPEGQRGAVDHYRSEPSGRESKVSEEEYYDIAEERRGSIRYYRNERPQLAEIEVWTAGDNIILGVVERGGFVSMEANAGDAKNIGATASDGRYSTGFTGTIFGGLTYDIFIDLGTIYWLDTLHFLNDGKSGFEHMAVDVSTGERAPDGSIRWTRVAGSVDDVRLIQQGRASYKFREFRIDPVRARYVRAPFGMPVYTGTQSTTGARFITLTELLLYGEGYVPEVLLTSDLVLLGGTKNLVSIDWNAETPPGTAVQLQTRSGNSLDEIFTYHDADGNVVTESRYNKLPKSKKGEITSFFKPGGDWSPWSTPYQEQGAQIRSPSPRQYMQIRAALQSEDQYAAPTLHAVTVDVTDPLASRLIGEIWPVAIDSLGRPSDLSFFIRPSFTVRGQGFDEVRIEATGETSLELVGALTGSDGDFENGAAALLPAADLEVMESEPGTLWFRLPETVGSGVDLVEVRFRATPYNTSTSFQALGQDSGTPGFWQRVDVGNATELVDSQSTTVLAISGNRVLQDLATSSAVLTPNGDGVNDEATFEFGIARISSGEAVSLRIYDLSGTLVGEFSEERQDPRGSWEMAWNGRDGSGNLVPPGIYIASVEVATQSATATGTTAQRLLHVAY